MRTARRLLLVALGLAALLLGARALARPLLEPALGFAAKVTCSGVLVGDETVAGVQAGFPDERLAAIVRLRVDTAEGRVAASVPLLGTRRAVHRPGLGCTLIPADGELRALLPRPVPASRSDRGVPWPDGEARVAVDADVARRLEAVIDSAFEEPADGPARRTRAIVIVHRGRIIAERYAPGYSPAHRFPGWSMAKSVTSALTGIMVGDGTVELAEARLRPEWEGDARSAITLEHLLRMSSGLAFDESYTPTGGATRLLFNTADVSAAAAASPLAHEPGTHWAYSSATTNLVADHLRKRLGSDAAYAAFPAQRLFHPLGMHSAVLEPDAAGTFVGSSFLYATARDWARFGLLYLRDGVWNGERILPEGWVAYSVTPAPAAPRGQYGAQWWLNAGSAADSTDRTWPYLPRDVYWASGYQGQYVAVLPSDDLVVVRLGVTNDERAWSLGGFLRSVRAALAPATADAVTSS